MGFLFRLLLRAFLSDSQPKRRYGGRARTGALRPGARLGGKAYVIDGDTVRVSGQRIRLAGLDAPEVDQVAKHQDGLLVQAGQARQERPDQRDRREGRQRHRPRLRQVWPRGRHRELQRPETSTNGSSGTATRLRPTASSTGTWNATRNARSAECGPMSRATTREPGGTRYKPTLDRAGVMPRARRARRRGRLWNHPAPAGIRGSRRSP